MCPHVHPCIDLHVFTCTCVHLRAYVVAGKPFGLTLLDSLGPADAQMTYLKRLGGSQDGRGWFLLRAIYGDPLWRGTI